MTGAVSAAKRRGLPEMRNREPAASQAKPARAGGGPFSSRWTARRVAVWALAPGALLGCLEAAGRPAVPGAIENYGRGKGMPIGTRGATEPPELAEPLAPGEAERLQSLSIPRFEARDEGRRARPAPCRECLELNVYVRDINQRDEFALSVGGEALIEVIWTLRVNFNSDQLAVQSFIDEERGPYTKLDVQHFPLGEPVALKQSFRGRAERVGLVVGSSGAWTGDQVLELFVDSLELVGPKQKRLLKLAGTTAGIEAATHEHQPKVVVHPPP